MIMLHRFVITLPNTGLLLTFVVRLETHAHVKIVLYEVLMHDGD